jgi:hypothetical protein
METNLDSYKYVCYPCGVRYNQYQGYEACALVLLWSCCTGESPLGILLALVSCARLGLGLVVVIFRLVFVVSLRAGICRGLQAGVLGLGAIF